jgi:hypothetical protein
MTSDEAVRIAEGMSGYLHSHGMDHMAEALRVLLAEMAKCEHSAWDEATEDAAIFARERDEARQRAEAAEAAKAEADGAYRAVLARLREVEDKAIRYDLDRFGIESRERDAVELVELRARLREVEADREEWQRIAYVETKGNACAWEPKFRASQAREAKLREALEDEWSLMRRMLTKLEPFQSRGQWGQVVNSWAAAQMPEWEIRQRLDALDAALAQPKVESR